MKIRYLGHSCYEITANSGVKIITDPYTGVGYELPSGLTSDILTVSHGHFDHAYTQAVAAKRIFDKSGEYSVEDIRIRGVDCFHDPEQGALRGKNVIFVMEVDGITLCHMGDIGEECSSALVEKIGKVDVLLVPVGGTYTVDAVGAKRYVDEIAPKVVIPMHYRPADGSLDITDAKPFLSLFAKENITCVYEGEALLDEATKGIIYMERVK